MGGKADSYVPVLVFLHQVLDSLIGAGLFWALNAYFSGDTQRNLEIAFLIFFAILVVFGSVGLYRSWRVTSTYQEFEQIIAGCFILYLLLLWVSYVLKILDEFSYRVVLSWMLLLPMVLGIERFALRHFLRRFRERGYNVRNAVIVGSGELAERLAQMIRDNPWSGTRLVGFFDDDKDAELSGCPYLGEVRGIPRFTRKTELDIIYSTLPMSEKDKIQWLLAELSDTTISFHIVPDIFFVDMILSADLVYFGNLPIIALRDTPLQGVNLLLKRAEDLLLASIILLAASPFMLFIAVAIKLTSRGPVLFSQWRYGLNGYAIKIYKFRTMTVCEDGYKFKQATQCDPRVTRLGAFLRRTSLDELPQFINVIQGRMSLVGPRPHPVAMNEKYRKVVPGYMLRHKVKPGITGLAQVEGWRGETDTLEKIEKRVLFDLEYLRQWSVLLDLKIIFKTIWTGAWRINSY